MKLGLVGVGRWGRLVAHSLVEVGCQVIFHDRQNPEDFPGFGARMFWKDMISKHAVDAVVICCPPDATMEIALWAQQNRMPALATKPFLLAQPLPLTCPLFIDYWRLFDPRFMALKDNCPRDRISHIDVFFQGKGPYRKFPGILDYGPHALTFLYNLLDESELYFDKAWGKSTAEGGQLYRTTGYAGPTTFDLTTGNGADEPLRRVDVLLHDGTKHSFVESPDWIAYERNGENFRICPRTRYLVPLATEFVDSTRRGVYSDMTVRYSHRSTMDLRKIQQVAAAGP